VAWHAATSKATDLVMTPLRMALWHRGREGHPVTAGQLVHHSDAGSQYTSIKFTDHLTLEGIDPSIGSVGDAYDNALRESTIGLYKTEFIKPRRLWKTLSQVALATAEWLDWYDHSRLHGETGTIHRDHISTP
jgi:putative transposase